MRGELRPGGSLLWPLIQQVCWLKSLFIGATLYLWASESLKVTELELIDCLMKCHYDPHFKHLDMKSWTNLIKILPGGGKNLRFIHYHNLFPGLIPWDYPFKTISQWTGRPKPKISSERKKIWLPIILKYTSWPASIKTPFHPFGWQYPQHHFFFFVEAHLRTLTWAPSENRDTLLLPCQPPPPAAT